MNQRYAFAFIILVGWAGCFASDGSEGDVDGGVSGDGGSEPNPLARVWPDIQPLPSCTPELDSFALPEVDRPSGFLAISRSAPVVPIGYIERLSVSVLNEDQASIDTNVSGRLIVETTNATVVSVGDIEDGYGHIDVRIPSSGSARVSIDLEGDDRRGRIELYGYETKLPVWEINVDPIEFANIWANPHERIEIEGSVKREGVEYETELRIHGGASRDFLKKSLRLKVKDSPYPDPKWVLRAEYVDKTMMRNWLGYELFRNGTWLPTPSSSWVHVRMNGRYYGLMNHTQRISGTFLKDWKLDQNSNLYEADPPNALSPPGGNLAPVENFGDFRQIYQNHNGLGLWEDLQHLVDIELQLSDEEFDKQVGEFLNVDSYLVYLAMMAWIQNQDHIRKNYYISHDSDGPDTRWYVMPWDLDLTLGHLWSPTEDVRSEEIITDGDFFTGEFAEERFSDFNVLTDRVLKNPRLRERFVALSDEIAERVFHLDFLKSRMDYMLCLTQIDFLADPAKRADNEEVIGRVEEIEFFVEERRRYFYDEVF